MLGENTENPEYKSGRVVDYACDPPNVSKARAIVENNLQQLRSTEVTPEELQQAKVLVLRGIPLSESSVASIATGWLNRSMLGLPLDEPMRAAQVFLQLTASDVRAAFAKWIRPNDWIQVTEGPAPK